MRTIIFAAALAAAALLNIIVEPSPARAAIAAAGPVDATLASIPGTAAPTLGKAFAAAIAQPDTTGGQTPPAPRRPARPARGDTDHVLGGESDSTAKYSRPVGLYAGSVGAGLVSPEGGNITWGLIGRVNIGDLVPYFSVWPTLEYWRKKDEVTVPEPLGDITTTRHAVTVAADLQHAFPMNGRLHPYAGGGVSIDFDRTTVTQDIFTETVSHVHPGFCLLGGVNIDQTESRSWFAEIKYRFVSNYGAFKILGGLNFNF